MVGLGVPKGAGALLVARSGVWGQAGSHAPLGRRQLCKTVQNGAPVNKTECNQLVCVAVGVVVLGRFRRSLRGAFLALRRPDRSDPGPLPRFLSARPALQVETFRPSQKKTGEGPRVPLLNLLESCRGPIYYHRPAPDC